MTSISPKIITALDATWAAIRKRHPDVPSVVITLASGASGKRLNYGHFAANRWQVGQDRLPEMHIGGEGLSRGARDVLGTLLHEGAHGVATTREIKDTSRQGRFHNRKFKALAEELGLEISHDRTIGWSVTTVPDATAALYKAELKKLETALVAFRHRDVHMSRANNNNALPVLCACNRRIRVAAAVLALGPIKCGVCEEEFRQVAS